MAYFVFSEETKMSLLEKLEKTNPKRNVVFTAVETLTDPTEMKQFYSEYVAHLKENGDSEEVRQDPESVANSNIGYIVRYYNRETADRWMNTIPSVSHPIFGKDIFSVTPEQAFNAGKLASTEGTEKAKDYIQESRK